MKLQTSELLIACAALPVLASIGVIVTTCNGYQRMSRVIACLGFAGGAVLGAILASILALATDAETAVVHVSLGTWFSFSLPQSPSMMFGLEATKIKAGMISLLGAFTLIAVWNAQSKSKETLSTDAWLATSLLYGAGTIFVFAPNTAQSLFGWGAVSCLVVILMRLSHQHLPPGNGQANRTQPTSSQTREVTGGNLIGKFEAIGSIANGMERFWSDRLWPGLTIAFPNWVGEQAETAMGVDSIALERIISVLGTAVILLTWLL